MSETKLTSNPKSETETNEIPNNPGRNVMRVLSQKIVSMVMDGFAEPNIQEQLKVRLVDPFTKMIYKTVFPYVVVMLIIMVVTLLSSLVTCIMLLVYGSGRR